MPGIFRRNRRVAPSTSESTAPRTQHSAMQRAASSIQAGMDAINEDPTQRTSRRTPYERTLYSAMGIGSAYIRCLNRPNLSSEDYQALSERLENFCNEIQAQHLSDASPLPDDLKVLLNSCLEQLRLIPDRQNDARSNTQEEHPRAEQDSIDELASSLGAQRLSP